MKSLTFFAYILSAGAAVAQPQYYRVTGVAADDTLNIRQEPAASSADIGDLPPDATGVEVLGTDASGDWGRIAWSEGMGWVAMAFLAPDDPARIGSTPLPVGLRCGGTEPFWSIRYGAESATYSDIEGTTIAMTANGSLTAEGMAGFPVLLSHGAPDTIALATIGTAICSDGMSDTDYPYSLTLLLQTGGNSRFLSGCCNLPLEIGSH